MQTVEWVFRFRWILWALGAWSVGAAAYRALRQGREWGMEGWGLPLAGFSARIRPFYRPALLVLFLGFVLVSSVAKTTQLHALALDAQDFWLFVDMLDQMLHGGTFLTRFAPQATGWVQHGAVHAFFNLYLAVPLAWAFGPVSAAILFGPLCIGASALVLASLVRPRAGEATAFLISLLFLCSSQIGKILAYDVHPEVAYPLFVLVWARSAGWGDGRIRWFGMLFALALGTQIKEDSIFVFLPLIGWQFWRTTGQSRRAALASFFVVVAGSAFQFHAIHEFATGAWGPSAWQGLPVKIPDGPAVFNGHHWDSPASALRIMQKIASDAGGFGALSERVIHFLLSRPWLSLLALAPWLALSPAAAFTLGPLLLIHGILGGMPATLMNYYSAPFLGTFWLLLATGINRAGRGAPSWALTWLLPAVLLLGSGGLEFFVPSQNAAELKSEVSLMARCLRQFEGRGVVAAPFIGLIPQARILSDRIPEDQEQWRKTEFVLFHPDLDSFGLPRASAQELLTRLGQSSSWVRWGLDCHTPDGPTPGQSVLYVRAKNTTTQRSYALDASHGS